MLVVLLLACFTVITLDARGGQQSPLKPVRSAAGDLFGPVERVTATAVRPFAAVPEHFRTTDALRRDLARTEAANAELRGRLAAGALSSARAAELDGMLASSRNTGYALLPARVIAMGPAQSFSRTVTIDAGTSSGVRADLTVLNNDGLVGRVLRADRFTATVLLIVDAESVVGGRLGSSLEVGFLSGRGHLGGNAPLDLELVDSTAAATDGDALVTWGSRGGAPYVAGIPIGEVRSLRSSPRQQSTQAVITPYVDFSSLDLVGVVVDPDTKGDRTVIRAARHGGAGER
ncbi:MAG TPA: rod shape-determining protein MreC [Nocardioidaceae bacterium]|nr:rod shape-determining protein MreC [Nocardioidaceae bacterium]